MQTVHDLLEHIKALTFYVRSLFQMIVKTTAEMKTTTMMNGMTDVAALIFVDSELLKLFHCWTWDDLLLVQPLRWEHHLCRYKTLYVAK